MPEPTDGLQKRDFKYRELLTEKREWEVAMSTFLSFRSGLLKAPALAFHANMMRTAYFQMWPTEIAFQSRRDTIFQCNAMNSVSGKQRTHILEFADSEPTEEFWAYFLQQITDLKKHGQRIQNALRVKLGVEYIEKMLEINDGMRHSIDAIFASIIMESWTAFEVMVSDVWVQIVNHGSAELRAKINSSTATNVRGSKDEKPVTPRIDPVLDFGGSLIEARRVSFQTLADIKEFYRLIITKPEVRRIFNETADGYLTALAAVRNILTHKRGIVDTRFITQVSKLPELNWLKENEILELDGGLVKKLRMAAMSCGLEVLIAADNMLSGNPTT